MLLDQLGRGLGILQGGLHDRMRLEELLRQDRLLKDGLQQRVLLQLLAGLLLALGLGAEGLLAAGETTAELAADAAARQSADAAAEALRLELLRSCTLLLKLSHVCLLVDYAAADDRGPRLSGGDCCVRRENCAGAIWNRPSALGTGAWTGGVS
jgi:hypothetical protein